MLEMCARESEFKSIWFALCYLCAVLAERMKFGAQGWNRSYPFNTGDFTIFINVLYNYLEANPKVNLCIYFLYPLVKAYRPPFVILIENLNTYILTQRPQATFFGKKKNNTPASKSQVQFDDLHYLFGYIMYRGHIKDGLDRHLCQTYLEEYIKPEMMEGELYPAPGFSLPGNMSHNSSHQVRQKRPVTQIRSSQASRIHRK